MNSTDKFIKVLTQTLKQNHIMTENTKQVGDTYELIVRTLSNLDNVEHYKITIEKEY